MPLECPPHSCHPFPAHAAAVFTPEADKPFDPVTTGFLQRPYTEPCLPDNRFQQYDFVGEQRHSA